MLQRKLPEKVQDAYHEGSADGPRYSRKRRVREQTDKLMAAFTSSGYFCCWFTSSREIKPISAMVPPAEVTLRSFFFPTSCCHWLGITYMQTVLCEKKKNISCCVWRTLSFHFLLFLFVLRSLCFMLQMVWWCVSHLVLRPRVDNRWNE